MKTVAYIMGLLGLALITVLVVRADVPEILHTWARGGVELLWLVPYRVVFFGLYAIGWRAMLRPFDREGRAGFGYVLWVTSLREAVDRLLPVASVGGGVIGVRLMRWRGIGAVQVSATVIVEILLTLFALYLFGVLSAIILVGSGPWENHRTVLFALVLSLPIPVGTLLLLLFGSVFRRMQSFLRPLVGLTGAEQATALDAALRACLARVGTLLMAGALQFVALVSASLEIWWAMRLFGHPISAISAVMLEGFIQTIRHLAFVVPAGLGVQEATLILFGHAMGISTELALAVSAVKRVREVMCGVPPLLAWQWIEARRLRLASISQG